MCRMSTDATPATSDALSGQPAHGQPAHGEPAHGHTAPGRASTTDRPGTAHGVASAVSSDEIGRAHV